MKIILFFMSCYIFLQCDGFKTNRLKRSAVGELHIVTNNEHPIHAEVQPENTGDHSEKVLPPADSVYQLKSLRKSRGITNEVTETATITPLTRKVEIIRSVNRLVTLTVLLISAVAEFYPLVKYLYDTFNNLIT